MIVAQEVQDGEVGEAAEFLRDRSCQKKITFEVQRCQIGEVAEFLRDGPGESIAAEVQGGEVGEGTEFWWNHPPKPIVGED